jgi:hypothetical protein
MEETEGQTQRPASRVHQKARGKGGKDSGDPSRWVEERKGSDQMRPQIALRISI